LAGFSQQIDLDEGVAMRIAQGFGGGSGSHGFCGAVAAAHMVLSFTQEVPPPDDHKKNRHNLYGLIKKFNYNFKEKHGSLHCVDLLGGLDPGKKEDSKKAREKKLFSQACPGFVKEAADLLDEILPE
jgi:C_GCAxxG_C_C family probable redox protein